MRKIGILDTQSAARRFSDYLFSMGIENEAELNGDDKWAIWVHDEDRLDEAEGNLARFAANPDHPDFREGAREGRARFAGEKKAAARSRNRVVDVRTKWSEWQRGGVPVVTMALIGISVATTILQNLPEGPPIAQFFSISHWKASGGTLSWQGGLPEILSGQVWRLVTPVFLHFGLIHILFNMMWLKQLGGAVESTEGQWNIAGQVLLYAVAGNLAQYFVSGPSFGGMSGVVYGLFGFIWICGKYDPNRPYALDRMTVGMMLGWAVLCLTGALGPIANTAHFVGLFGGIVWAAVTVRRIPFTPIRF